MLNFKTSARLTILALFAACTDAAEAPTQVLVVIDAEPGVRASTEALEVRVSGPTGDGGAGYHETFRSQDDLLIWPRVVALVPMGGDVGREYEVVATARDANGTFVAEVRAISGFVDGEKRQLDLLLEDACIGRHCEAGETCAAGVCNDAHIAAEALGPFSAKDLPEPVNVPFEGRELQLDAGPDAETPDPDAAVDAGLDGGGDGGSLPSGCRSTGQAACPIACPELCNNEDDDCDDAVDEEEAADDCELSNAVARCQDGLCLVDNCLNTMRNCDGAPENGCETPPDSVNHCTACNVPCSFPNEIAACVSSACVAIGCKDGFADCNATASSCETSTLTLANCGSCGVVCSPLAHVAVPSCETGSCGAETCQSGHGDCDEVPSNGCEQTLDSLEHCAACDVPCDFVGSTDSCATGSCQASSCDSGYDNCDGDPFDGCEPLNTASNCAACGEVCDGSLDNVASAVCPSMVCELTCEDGFDDCDTTPGNGCEQALDSLNHCGGCNVPCDIAHAAESCATGACVRVTCEDGYGDCNGLPGDGCEQQLNTLAHCGACQTPCNLADCSSGSCTAANCTPPMADCDGDGTSCETNTSGDVGHCGACNAPCQFTTGTPNATISGCTSGACQIQCVGAFLSCDADYKNGCETSTQTLANCGGCGQTCNIPNAVETCSTGSCKVASCDSGWGNCDANPDTCETSLTTVTSCGSCGAACNLLNASEICAGSFPGVSCQISACDAAHYRDCDTQAATGCEVDTRTDVGNCGACGNDCGQLPKVERASCASSACHVEVCAEGFADCDGNPLNGCEHDLKNGACPGFGYMPRNFDPSGMVFGTTYPATCAVDFTLVTSDYAPTAPPGSTCSAAQVHDANGHKYFVCRDARNHDEAQGQCASIGGNLVTIEDDKEKEFLGSLVGSDTVWIGGNDIDVEGQWRWSRGGKDDGALFWQGASDGAAVAGLYAHWDGAQPDDFNSGEDCAELSGSAGGLWFDNDCAVQQGYVCELQAVNMDSFAASCGGQVPETRVVTQAGAPDLLVVMLTSLTVNAGVTITLRGSRPVAFAVVGNAVVSGTLDASAAGATAGAGGGQSCAGSTGSPGASGGLGAGNGGGGGGGHAVAGAKGGKAGTLLPGDGVGGNGGVAIADPNAVPLRGGCSGGAGGAGPSGGVGGGAVQVSVGGTLTLASTARMHANGSGGVSAGAGTAGGGGGGSGGTVLIQGGALSIDSGAQLTAHGGPGGAGSGGGAAGGGRGTAIYKDNALSTNPPTPNPAPAGMVGNGGAGGGAGFGRVVVPPPGT